MWPAVPTMTLLTADGVARWCTKNPEGAGRRWDVNLFTAKAPLTGDFRSQRHLPRKLPVFSSHSPCEPGPFARPYLPRKLPLPGTFARTYLPRKLPLPGTFAFNPAAISCTMACAAARGLAAAVIG